MIFFSFPINYFTSISAQPDAPYQKVSGGPCPCSMPTPCPLPQPPASSLAAGCAAAPAVCSLGPHAAWLRASQPGDLTQSPVKTTQRSSLSSLVFQSSFLATAFQKGAIGTEFLCQLVWESTCGGDQALSLASGAVCSGSPHRGRHHSSSCK